VDTQLVDQAGGVPAQLGAVGVDDVHVTVADGLPVPDVLTTLCDAITEERTVGAPLTVWQTLRKRFCLAAGPAPWVISE
jgi:hypothetical protein